MSVHAKVFGFCCIDPRYRSSFEQFLEKKFDLSPTEYEIKADAGSSREITVNTSVGEWLVKNAELAYKKHGVRTFVLCSHVDCAYYGGSGHFSSIVEESNAYADDMRKSARILGERLPGIKVYGYIVNKEPIAGQEERFVFQEVVLA